MLVARIRECLDCGNLQSLLNEINCSIAQMGRNHWLNLSFDACNYYKRSDITLLLHYKRIIQKKIFNPDYACDCNYELASIVSRVKTLLLRKDCCSLNDQCEFPTADTFEEVSNP